MHCFVLHIGLYIYIVQITKGRIRPVLTLNMQIPDQVECLFVFACLKASKRLVGLIAFCKILIYIPVCCKKQYINQTKYAAHHSRTNNNEYIGIGTTCL